MACEHRSMTAHYDWEQTLVCDDCQKSEAEILREEIQQLRNVITEFIIHPDQNNLNLLRKALRGEGE